MADGHSELDGGALISISTGGPEKKKIKLPMLFCWEFL